MLWVFGEAVLNGEIAVFCVGAKHYDDYLLKQNFDSILQIRIEPIKEKTFQAIHWVHDQTFVKIIYNVLKDWALHSN